MKKIVIPGLLAAVLMTIVGMGIGMIFNAAVPSLGEEYMNPAIFRAWDEPLMQLFFVYPFILGFALAWVWDKVKGLIKGNMWKRGLVFGLVFFLIGSIPGMFISYSTFQVSFLMVLSWTLNGLTNGVISGWVFAKLNK